MRLEDLLASEPRSSRADLAQISIDPADPALFLLSGIPKLIPRTHNDYLYNSRIAAAVCEIGAGDVLLDVLPIEHNLAARFPALTIIAAHPGSAATTRACLMTASCENGTNWATIRASWTSSSMPTRNASSDC